MYTNPNDDGKRPIKLIFQQSNISMTMIGFKGIMFRFEIDPTIWQFLYTLQNACESLNNVGQWNLHCNVFVAVVF